MTAASKWVDEAMSLAFVATDAAWDAGKCEEYGAKLAAPDVELRDRKLEELRAHLTTQAALCEQLAEALKELVAAGDDYKNPFADDIQMMVRFGQADEEARAALLAYEGSKQ